ncbi:hypothetical protein LSG31_09205 [Fodinisporobacter ferrooxydans]|uniref:Lipoprotein n=1 Tax=Fodinisporobacter ferrooxydans TaxID=2901836 RepID=A0ABY4CSA9_9BACL|nr:hypothetical protein LSG31_09205 [Alicyclobacillaceae bacterium MYW30-H2]
MKKKFTFVLVGAILAGFLTGCGTKSDQKMDPNMKGINHSNMQMDNGNKK